MKDKSFAKFLVIWLGEFISNIGSGLTAFGLGVYVFQLSGSATDVSLVTLCAFLPMILFNPIGGVFADRYDRRLMMIIGDGVSALGLIYMLVIYLTGELQVWQICAAVFFSSSFSSLTDPAFRASITDLLTEEQYGKASGLVQMSGSSRFLLSPFLAGLILAVSDISTIFIIDILTFIVTVIAIFVIRGTIAKPEKSEAKGKTSFFADLKEGWKTIRDKNGVIPLIVLVSLVNLFMGIFQTLVGPMMLSFTDSKTYGIAESICASGMLVGSLLIGIIGMKKNYLKALMVSLCVAGLGYSLFGLRENVVWIICTGFLFFITLPFANTSMDIMIRRSIPDEKQGRAWGMISVISQFGTMIAYATCGMLADKVFSPLLMEGGAFAGSVGRVIGTGPGRGIGFLFFIAGLCVIAGGVLIYRNRSVRALDAELESTK